MMSLGRPPERKLELELGPTGPWHAIVRVHAVSTRHGRKTILPHDWLFEVSAEWVGPPAAGFPPSPRPVSSRDVYVVYALDDARWLAYEAALALGKGGDYPPDLRELAKRK